MASRFYVTTPIYYINDVPHLGSAYTTIAADVLARYHRARGHDTYFLTGTDEHGLKIQRASAERGMSPQAFADEVSAKFRETWPKLGCQPDDFIRTTEERHTRGVQALWQKIAAAGDLYLGAYEGLYCVGCEGYKTEKELKQPGNICPDHNRPVEMLKEESYFFRLSKYQDRLLEFYRAHPDAIRPETRRNEVLSFVKEGLQDLSVSRTTFQWGVPVPNDPRHVMFVWFDALANYYTALLEPNDNSRFWPCSEHLVGKDIIRFHAVYWPAFLMAAGFADDALPQQVFAHGFLTYNGQKMSKSLRNTVSPTGLAEAIEASAPMPAGVGVDTLRYCLMRAISFGNDGDFSVQDLIQRYSSELGNALGNLLNRVLPFADKVPEKAASTPLEDKLREAFAQGAAAAAKAFDESSPTRALEAIWAVLAAANEYVDKAAPWAAKKSDPARLGTIIATLVELLEAVSVMISPVLPSVADAMREQLGLAPLKGELDRDQWPFALPARAPGGALKKGSPIFPRLEKDKEAALIARFSPALPDAPAAPAAAPAAASAAATTAATAPAASAPAAASASAPAASASAASASAAAPAASASASAPAAASASASAPAAASASASAPAAAPVAREAKDTINFPDFAKLDLRVGLVISADRIKKKDKLLDLRIDTGDGAPRRIVSGIAAAYSPEALVGKRVIVLCNLAPRDFGKGLVSEGMLLTAEDEAGLKVLSVDGDKIPGAGVS